MSDTKPKRAAGEAMPKEMLPAGPPEDSAVTIAPVVEEPRIAEGLAAAATVGPEPAAAEAWSAAAEVQTVLARGFEEIAAEMAAMTRTGLAAGADAAIQLLGARTFAEVVEIQAGLARRGFDTAVDCSAKVSAIAARAMTALARPAWSRLACGAAITE